MNSFVSAVDGDQAEGVGCLSLLDWGGDSNAGQGGCEESLGEHFEMEKPVLCFENVKSGSEELRLRG